MKIERVRNFNKWLEVVVDKKTYYFHMDTLENSNDLINRLRSMIVQADDWTQDDDLKLINLKSVKGREL